MKATSFWFLCLVIVTAGCGDFNKAMNSDRKPVAPTGILPADQSADPLAASPAPPMPPGGAAPPVGPPAANPGPPALPDPIEAKRQSLIARTTSRVVDKKKAMAENSSLVEIENSAQGGDPISFAASAYITIRSKASTLGFQKELTDFKGLNGRSPTYEELQEMMKTHRVEFAMLPAYQMYGYDADKGMICVLEDKADKARRYQEAGIPVE